jgi:acyl-CoA thioester hydrolase
VPAATIASQERQVMVEATEWSHPALLEVGRGTVAPAWIDYNGHMNVVHYRAAFDLATDDLFAHLGFAPDSYTATTGATLMVLEEHTRYHAELTAGERYRVLARLVGHAAKTVHYLLYMENLSRGGLAATHEEIALHVELAERRSSPLPREGLAAIEALEAAQAGLPRPADLGRVIAT